MDRDTDTTTVRSVAVLGDSMSVGFATGGRAYGVLVAEGIGAGRVDNLSALGRTTRQMLDEDVDRVAALGSDLVIVYAGMADSLPHPGRRVQALLERFAPPTWHGVDGLHRRAYFSGSRRARARQWLTATAKTTLKRVLIATTGGYTRMQPGEFGDCLDGLFTRLEAQGRIVVSPGMFDADERIFPRQNRLNIPFRAQRFAVLARHPDVIAVEIDHRLLQWDHYLGDHAHWNQAGHAAVADEILLALRARRPDLLSTHGTGPVRTSA